jgi:hypothetical protein
LHCATPPQGVNQFLDSYKNSLHCAGVLSLPDESSVSPDVAKTGMNTVAPVFPFSYSSSQAALAGGRAGPPRRILLALAAGVLLGHALLLKTTPSHVALMPTPTPKPVAAMYTRSITPAPAPASPPPAAARPLQPSPQAAPQKKPAAAAQPPAPSDEASDDDAPAPAITDVSIDWAGARGPAEVKAPAAALPPAPDATPVAAAPAASAPAAAPASPSPAPVTAMRVPASAQLSYKMTGSAKGLTYHAKAELLWQHSGASSSYDASLTVSALFLGARSMRSRGQVSAQGLAPSRFSDKSRTEVAAHFEPDKGQVSFSANTPSVPWVQGAQDRVSILIQLGAMLAGNPAGFADGASISIYTVGPRGADTWTFRVEGVEMLQLPVGEMATLKLSRQLRHDYDQQLEVWYAPALGFLPVRNKITQANGDFVDQQLSDVNRL